jgi:hypothetical protein
MSEQCDRCDDEKDLKEIRIYVENGPGYDLLDKAKLCSRCREKLTDWTEGYG